ncbi:MAG: hypothetical protein WA655_18905 [Candidatus Korobacteraceae bacterium]
MKFGRQFVIGALAIGLIFLTACTKRKAQLPNQAQVPMDTVAVPLPNQIAEVSPPPPPPEPKQEEPTPEEPKPAPVKHHRRKPAQPPVTTQANGSNVPPNPAANASANNPASASSNNTTVAVAHPPANPADTTPPDTAIAADVTTAQLSQQKQTTAQLLDATEKTLGGLNRGLSHDEEEMVAQIRSYVTQSKNATTAGDFERAYNLATKAHLLSDALVKK